MYIKKYFSQRNKKPFLFEIFSFFLSLFFILLTHLIFSPQKLSTHTTYFELCIPNLEGPDEFYPLFTVKQLLEDWAYSEIYVMVMPAIAAVAAVNVIIILYVISAFRQERRSFKTDWEYILLQFSFIASLQILSRSHGCM